MTESERLLQKCIEDTSREVAKSDKMLCRMLEHSHKGRECWMTKGLVCQEGWCLNCETFYNKYWEGYDSWFGFCDGSRQLRRVLEQCLGLRTDWCTSYDKWADELDRGITSIDFESWVRRGGMR